MSTPKRCKHMGHIGLYNSLYLMWLILELHWALWDPVITAEAACGPSLGEKSAFHCFSKTYLAGRRWLFTLCLKLFTKMFPVNASLRDKFLQILCLCQYICVCNKFKNDFVYRYTTIPLFVENEAVAADAQVIFIS